LERVANKTKHPKDIAKYETRNVVAILSKEARKTFYENLDPNELSKNKVFLENLNTSAFKTFSKWTN